MSKLYSDQNWLDFRQLILEADGYACTECGRGKDDVVLQVHHKEYIKGKLPWDYPTRSCETLCRGCHARHHGEIQPSKGWDLCYENDLEDLNGKCDLCGANLRFEFYIDHPKWHPMIVGSDCCDKLTNNTEASASQKHQTSLIKRRKNFLISKRWKRTPFGFQIKQDKIRVTIQAIKGTFRITMDRFQGKREFSKLDEAKAFVFDCIESGEAQKFINKHQGENHGPWEIS